MTTGQETTTAKTNVAHPNHYVPAIDRFVVKALFHEARHRGIPMTRIVNDLLRAALMGSAGWNLAQAEIAGIQRHEAQREAA